MYLYSLGARDELSQIRMMSSLRMRQRFLEDDDNSDFAASAKGAAAAPVHISHARIVREPEKFWSVEWVKHQALTTSWANVALAITLLVLSSELAAQQKTIADQQQTLANTMQDATDLLNSFNNQRDSLETFNTTLNYAFDRGILKPQRWQRGEAVCHSTAAQDTR